MPVRCVRPQVQDLRFHFFSRSIHPELLNTLSETRLSFAGFEIHLKLTQSGHLIEYQREGLTISELVAAKQTPLPKQKRHLLEQIRGSRHVDCQPSDSVQFHAGLQVETLDEELFQRLQSELLIDSEDAHLVQTIGSEGRLGFEAISFIMLEQLSDALLVGTVHTFPDDCAIVKTQSLLEYR